MPGWLANVPFTAVETLAEESPVPVVGDLVDVVEVHHPETIGRFRRGCGAGN